MDSSLEGLELYGFSGKMGTGKNYIAEKLFKAMLPVKNTLVMALADHFKVECISKDGVAYHRVFGEKDQESRDMLQKRGTEEGRDVYGKEIWIKTLETWIRRHHETGLERVIITDLRYQNEVEWLKKMGGMTFRVVAPERNMTRLQEEAGDDTERMNQIANHNSEIELDNREDLFDFVIHNDYSDQHKVANKIRDIIRQVIYKDPVPLTIFCDLDDTICQCKRFYQDAINRVVSMIKEKTGISQELIETLLAKHVLSYEKRYYTHNDFSNSLAKVATEAYLVQDRVMEFNHQIIEEIDRIGNSVYDQTYDPLYSDSVARVREMKKIGQVVIFTLGDYTEQMKKIVNLGLLDFQIEIFTHKDKNMFRYLQNKYPSREYVMIGDSYARDIIPAAEAGIRNLVQIFTGQVENKTDKVLRIERLNDTLMTHLQGLL